MKPWNKANLIWLAVIGTVAICTFFALALIINYFELGGTYWFALLLALVPYVYGCVVFVKKYLPKKADYFPETNKQSK